MVDLQLVSQLAKTDIFNYQISISDEKQDRAWDSFLRETPGGHHTQTSLWAQVKANQGWQAVRIIAREEERIVAGAQILLQALPIQGSVGYLFNGPLFAKDDLDLQELMTQELKRIAKANHVQILIVQLPKTAGDYAESLPNNGFSLGKVKIALSATTILDMSPDLEAILAQMKSKTRYNIRLSERKGITVREGNEADIPAFHHLLTETGKRQNFAPSSEEYFANMMRILGPYDHFKLFFAEYDGEPVSAMLAIPFGDTVIYKRGAWAGAHGDKRPNEAMHWAAIQWAKSRGYRFYDFDGIEPPVARLILQNEPVPREMLKSVTRFKLGFTTGVVLLPPPYEYLYNPVLRWGYKHMYPRLAKSSRFKRILKQLRSR